MSHPLSLPRGRWLPLILAAGLIAPALPWGGESAAGTPAPIAAPAPTAALTPTPAATLAPTPTPVAVSLLGPTPYYAATGMVSFAYSRHYYRPGDTVAAAVHVNTAECRILACYVGATWTAVGAPPGHCRPAAVRCSWPLPAATPLYQWQGGRLSITTTLGSLESADFYAVIPRSQSVLETRVTDVSGNPYAGLAVRANGPISATLTSDSNGFAVGLVPSGSYRTRLDPGTPTAGRWFRPLARSLSVRGVATAHVVGYNHLQIVAGRRSVVADGVQAVTVTVRGLNPFGQPVAGMGVRAHVSGLGAVLCSLTPNQLGYLEPQDVIGGMPRYVPVAETADGTGTLSYRAYFGTEPGTWRLSIRDGSLGVRDPWLGRLTVSTSVRARPARWATSFPTRLAVGLYGARGRRTTVVIPLSQALWHALRGETVPPALKQAVAVTALNVADVAGSQKAVLRWLDYYAPLRGLEIGPVFAAGANNWGVAIFLHHRFGQRAVTRILDANTLATILAAVTPRRLPALPTLAAWAARTHSTVVRGYGAPVAEAGLTYYGMPYLPRTDPDLASFEASCGQRAPS